MNSKTLKIDRRMKMKYIGYTLLLVSVLMLLGTVGGIEHNTMPLAKGIAQSIAYLALMVVSGNIIKKCEEK